MHVILLAPHFPANQRRFLRGLKAVGARVTGIVDSPIEHVDHEVARVRDVPVLQQVDSLPGTQGQETFIDGNGLRGLGDRTP